MKEQYTPKLKSYHIILFAIFLCPLIILNSNYVNRKRQEQKEQILLEQLYLRKLDFKSDTEAICKKGSKDLQEYYASGDSEKIGIDDDKIENKDKGKHIDALVNIVSSEGEMSSNLMDYGMHLIPVLVFFVIAFLSLPGWLVCCICNCCNCCCCCCCKKNSCKFPFFIITSVIYALVLGICVYGLSQSNSIFVGFADTECSILQLMNEFIEGESKDVTPKWPGMSGIKTIFTKTGEEIDKLDGTTSSNLVIQKEAVETKKRNFESALESQSGTISADGYHSQNLNGLSNENKRDSYQLDIIKSFGEFTKATSTSEVHYTPNTLAEWWYKEYIETANKAEQFMTTVSENYGQLNSKKNEAKNVLKNIEDSISDMESSINGVKDMVSGAIFEYGNYIEEYGKLGFKAVFSALMVIDIAIAVFMTLLLFFSSSFAKYCYCCRCLFKALVHILWNILALLTFFTLLLGSIFTLIGTVGQDLTSVVSFLVSDDNLSKENPVLLEEESKTYLQECINGEGNVKKVIGVDLTQLNNIDKLKTAESKIEEAEKEANKLKEGKFAYKRYLELFKDRTEYRIDNFNLVSSDKSISFKDTLNEINRLITNEEWSISCSENVHDCNTLRESDGSFYCIKPSTCSTKKPSDWYSSPDNLSDNAKILDAFIASIKDELEDSTGNINIGNALNTLVTAYETFLTEEVSTLRIYKSSITDLTSIFNRFAGKEGDAFSIINCKFLGRNVKVILKFLKKSLGKSFYTVGVCLLTSGVGMLVSISLTILLNTIINVNAEKK